jgi:hypothetical protein
MSEESESISESKKNFVDPNPNPKKKFSDPQHCHIEQGKRAEAKTDFELKEFRA